MSRDNDPAVTGSRHRLDWQQLVDALDALAGRRVAIRIVEPEMPERLVVVVHGTLGRSSPAKHPSTFWPLDGARGEELEQPGLYLSPRRVEAAEWRPGGILVIRERLGVINVRPL